MRTLVRLVAVMLVVEGPLASIVVFIVLGNRAGFANILQFSRVPALTIALSTVGSIGGLIAAIQLWRFRKSGWTIGLLVFLVGLLNDLGSFMFPGPKARPAIIAASTAFHLLGIILLGLTSWRRTGSAQRLTTRFNGPSARYARPSAAEREH